MKYNILHTKYTSQAGKKNHYAIYHIYWKKHDFLKFDSINMNKKL